MNCAVVAELQSVVWWQRPQEDPDQKPKPPHLVSFNIQQQFLLFYANTAPIHLLTFILSHTCSY